MNQSSLEKKEIRTYIKKKKSALSLKDISERSNQIIENILNMQDYIACENLFTYVNFNQEVETTCFIQESFKRGKHVFVPKVFPEQGNRMEFFEIHDLTDLSKGYYGVLEPRDDINGATKIRNGIFIMPGLAFDREFHRVGYGGGFYDRYLAAPHEFKTIAVAFDFQLLNQVPYEIFDLKPEMIVTEHEVLSRKDRKGE